MRLVESDKIRLSPKGKSAVRRWKTDYNQCMIEALDAYLAEHSLNREELEGILKKILNRRELPTPAEIRDYLPFTGPRMPSSELRLVLDLLGHIGALRVAREGQRVYFPW
jgi:hypothetical protein